MRKVAVVASEQVEDRLEGVLLGIDLANNGYDFFREVETGIGDVWMFCDNKSSVPDNDLIVVAEIVEKGRAHIEVVTLSTDEDVEVHVY